MTGLNELDFKSFADIVCDGIRTERGEHLLFVAEVAEFIKELPEQLGSDALAAKRTSLLERIREELVDPEAQTLLDLARAQTREDLFRADLQKLLNKHNAELSIGDDGRPYGLHSGTCTVFMAASFDKDGNQLSAETEFNL